MCLLVFALSTMGTAHAHESAKPGSGLFRKDQEQGRENRGQISIKKNQDLTPLTPAVDIGEVVVTGDTHRPPLDETASAVTLKPGDAPLATSAVQLLEQAAGVNVRRFGGIDDFSALSMRGSTPSQVQIYLDDVPLVTAQGTITDLNIIPLSALAGIDVYRGGAPGVLPESAIGGVVVLRSKPKPDAFEWNVYGGYGSFDTLRLGVNQAQAVGDVSYRFAYDYYRSAGDFTYIDNRGTTFNTDDDELTVRRNNDFTQNAFFANVAYDAPAGWRISLIESLFVKGQGVPGLGSRTSLNARLATLRNLAAVTADIPHMAGDSIDGRFNVFFDFLNSRFDDPNGEIGLGPQRNDDDTYRAGGFARIAWRAGRHQLITFTAGLRSEFYVPHVTLGMLRAGSPSNRHSVSGGVEDEITVLDDRVTIVPSARVEGVFNHLADSSAAITNDADHVEFSAKLGVRVRLIDGLDFRGNVYRGFRQPTFNELFGDRGALVGNPRLKPETGFNVDAGLSWRAPDTSWSAGARIEAAYFRNAVDDLIQFLQTSQFTAKAFNLNDALIQGAEFSARATFLNRLAAAVSYTFQDAKDTSNTVTDGKYLPGRPRHELGAMLTWRERFSGALGTSVSAEYLYMSDMYLDTQNLLVVKDRSILTAGLGVTVHDRVTATFTARNILNDRTVDAVGYPLPGRSYWGNVEVRL